MAVSFGQLECAKRCLNKLEFQNIEMHKQLKDTFPPPIFFISDKVSDALAKWNNAIQKQKSALSGRSCHSGLPQLGCSEFDPCKMEHDGFDYSFLLETRPFLVCCFHLARCCG